MSSNRQVCSVNGVRIDVMSWEEVLHKLHSWSSQRDSRYVCICNVHSVITTTQDNAYAKIIDNADMATPDGAPIAWMMRRMGHIKQSRINGPDLMWKLCQQAEKSNQSVFFYGGTEKTLSLLKKKLEYTFPNLKIAGAISPPFHTLTPEEDAEIVQKINDSGTHILWVSLGCPKQELWMAEHRGRINAVMLGVGAAFDYHAGTLKRAPKWMQNHGLEWSYRLASEPRRLWKRYFVTNTLFIVNIVIPSLGGKNRFLPPSRGSHIDKK